jgi:hypothetical protein
MSIAVSLARVAIRAETIDWSVISADLDAPRHALGTIFDHAA